MKLTIGQSLDLEEAMREAAKDFDAGTIAEILDTGNEAVIEAAFDAISEADITINLGGAR